MHVPDGFLDAPTSLGTAAVAAVGVGLALRGARRERKGRGDARDGARRGGRRGGGGREDVADGEGEEEEGR